MNDADLRTLVPPDLELVIESVGRTGRLVVVAEDRPFAGFVRSIQGAVIEALPGTPTLALGQRNLPGIAQSIALEHQQILTDAQVVAGVHEVLEMRTTGSSSVAFVPHRYFIG